MHTKTNIDKHVFLVGRPPLAEFLAVVKAEVGSSEREPLANEWREANQLIQALEKTEAGAADQHQTQALPASLQPLIDQALSDDIFQRAFGVVPYGIEMVELDKLVVCQKHINLNYVQQIIDGIKNSVSDQSIFELCIPSQHPMPPISAAQVSENAFVFSSPSADLRALDAVLLDNSQVSGFTSTGPIAKTLGIAIGSGANCLSALSVNGRMVLNNGSHRAYALRSMGLTHAPCIVQHISHADELAVVAIRDFLDNPTSFLKDPRPSMLKDYFNPQLIKILPVQRKQRQIKVSYTIETIDVPVM